MARDRLTLTGPRSIDETNDEEGTVAYMGTFQMREASPDNSVQVLPNYCWEDARAAISRLRPRICFSAAMGSTTAATRHRVICAFAGRRAPTGYSVSALPR